MVQTPAPVIVVSTLAPDPKAIPVPEVASPKRMKPMAAESTTRVICQITPVQSEPATLRKCSTVRLSLLDPTFCAMPMGVYEELAAEPSATGVKVMPPPTCKLLYTEALPLVS